MSQNFYYFNTKTLTFEKKEFSWRSAVKRVLWWMATVVAFSAIVIWISFYLIDSPKELMLKRENNQLERELSNLDKRYDQLLEVTKDIQNRDDKVYRTIFETAPVPMSERYPFLVHEQGYEYICKI